MKTKFVRGSAAAADECCRVAFARSAGRWRVATSIMVLVLAAFVFVSTGCSSKKKVDEISGEDTSGDSAGEPQPPPVANVEITYSRPNDSLERATVSKFFGAEVIQNTQTHSGRSAALIRFDGGVPIWEIKADRSLAGRITDIGSSGWAIKQLEYGKVPAHFSQLLPDEGPPEPLDRGSFYVFTIERSSGATSYQAVKVLADGSLQAYAAQPRAGSSFLLCCGLATDFSEPVILPEDITPDDSNPDNPAPPPDQDSGGAPQQ